MASNELRELTVALRDGGPDLTTPPEVARPAFEEMLATIPVADDLVFTQERLGNRPALRSEAPGARTRGALLYLHGGAFVIGSPQGYRGLSGELGRVAGIPAFSLDYRLAPEHVFPAAVDDAVAAYHDLLEAGFAATEIVIAGDSAGGGLALSTLVRLRGEGAPMPAAALLLSPWTDLSCQAASIKSKAAVDPALTEDGLLAMAGRYLGAENPDHPLASPINADLGGLPPLLIQVGSAEILLDDAVGVAAKAGAEGTKVQLEIWPDAVHVWQAFAFMLPEGRAALASAGAFLRQHLEG